MNKYAYNFDIEVMHPFMLRSFAPFFVKGNVLELGSYKGDFTKKLLNYFRHFYITCVDSSFEDMEEARGKVYPAVEFIKATFEEAKLPHRYDNIIMTHVLEHLDDPIKILKRINEEWLSSNGRLFLVCPNANAASRQIAVLMGVISHNSAVMPSEAIHGHRRTYSFNTLERDTKAAGLKIIHRSGIFFKALSNFQWDLVIKEEIVSPEYLEGCYQLGQQYPDLCSSIFLVCGKGRTI